MKITGVFYALSEELFWFIGVWDIFLLFLVLMRADYRLLLVSSKFSLTLRFRISLQSGFQILRYMLFSHNSKAVSYRIRNEFV